MLRLYWYDGAIGGLHLTTEQSVLAKMDDVKIRLGHINTAGQQKGVDSLIVTDLIELARQKAICDAVLLSGDEDVRVGVQIAQNYGVRVHLLGIHPSRGSQSLQLLHEVDTASEWAADMVRSFLAVRGAATAGEVSASSPPLDVRSGSLPETADMLEAVADQCADELQPSEIASVASYIRANRSVPSELDGRLLALAREKVGRLLSDHERKRIRALFRRCVDQRARAGS